MKDFTKKYGEMKSENSIIWNGREKKEKVSCLIGLSRSPLFKPISSMEVGEYEYWLRSNEDLFNLIPQLGVEISNLFNQFKYGNEKIIYSDFQEFGFKIESYDENNCFFIKRTNDFEINGEFLFKDNKLFINNTNGNCFNGIILNKNFLLQILLSTGCITQQEMFGIGRK